MDQLLDAAPIVADDTIDSAAGGEDARVEEKPEANELDALYPDEKREEPSEGDEGADEDDLGDDDLDPDVNDDLPAIEAPRSWEADKKEIFAKLPRDVQEYVNKRENERDRFVQQKSQEAAQAKVHAEREAQSQLAQMRQQEAEQYEQLASTLLPEPPDRNLLFMGDTLEEQMYNQRVYQQQQAVYDNAVAQQHQLQQIAQSKRGEAQQLAQTQAAWEQFNEHRKLHQQRPDWFDDSEPTQFLPDGTAIPPKLKPEIVSRLQPIGEALGYGGEQLASANVTDFLALETASTWKAKADKYDELQKRKMEGVRAAKALPKIAKPGVATGARTQSDDPIKILYPND